MRVSAEETLPLRQRVLRADTPDAPAGFPEDPLPTTVHLAATPAKSTAPPAVDYGKEGGAKVSRHAVIDSRVPEGAVDFDLIVGVATLFPSAFEGREDAWQLRGMAVAPEVQGSGVGGMLLDEGVRIARKAGATLLWANGRDTAVGFYERQGWKVVGDGFVYGPAGLPHHLVVLYLS